MNTICFFFGLFIFCLCSFFKNAEITIDLKKPVFYELTQAGLTIIIVSAVLFFLTLEFGTPFFYRSIGLAQSNTEVAQVILDMADSHYNNKEYNEALSAYQKYSVIVKPNSKIREKIRQSGFHISREKEINEELQFEVPDTITNPFELADYYYLKGDYVAAWYYYQLTGDTTPAERKSQFHGLIIFKKY